MKSSKGAKALYTASEIARFCQVDLKTIHNWSERGQIRHFRTPGRHLRFRREDVLHFLHEFGYPLPSELKASRRRVVAIDGGGLDGALSDLGGDVELRSEKDAWSALISIGHEPPDVVLVDGDAEVDLGRFLSALRSNPVTRTVETVIVGGNSHVRSAADEAGATQLEEPSPRALRDVLEARIDGR